MAMVIESMAIPIEKIVLEKTKISIQKHIPWHMIDNMTSERYLHAFSGDLAITLSTYVATSRSTSSVRRVLHTCERPLTWLDSLRMRHFPNFLTSRYPIKKETIPTELIEEQENVYVFPDIIVPQNSYISNFLVAYSKEHGIDNTRREYTRNTEADDSRRPGSKVGVISRAM
jgi:hypothetical protein